MSSKNVAIREARYWRSFAEGVRNLAARELLNNSPGYWYDRRQDINSTEMNINWQYGR